MDCDYGHASMGPRLSSRGNFTGAVAPKRGLLASMGPRLSSRGNVDRHGLVQRVLDASMGPRLSSRGNSRTGKYPVVKELPAAMRAGRELRLTQVRRRSAGYPEIIHHHGRGPPRAPRSDPTSPDRSKPRGAAADPAGARSRRTLAAAWRPGRRGARLPVQTPPAPRNRRGSEGGSPRGLPTPPDTAAPWPPASRSETASAKSSRRRAARARGPRWPRCSRS